ncbi:hypothetical protein KHX94_11255 [Shewanella dokdonensis]|uniref:Uncharacterized protein n=1 Tax=Shewanella dokdonensis TaxID=712036 RepID=A0ABX8DBJ4_9GAMM|nr:hypothetical protein [Shewanella dokdonensis]QVK22051.1 hypothetical protein KHX94_11255 [Shewanella dokdonensis]
MAVSIKGLLRASVLLFYPISLYWCQPASAVPVSIPPLMTAAEMLTQLNQRLVHSKNAPATLSHWCSQQLNNADAWQVILDTGRQLPPPAEVYQLLNIAPKTPLSYLKQRFMCSGKVVAVFDHWFRADMLTPAMQQALAKQDTALGSIAREAGFFAGVSAITRCGQMKAHCRFLSWNIKRSFTAVTIRHSASSKNITPGSYYHEHSS